MSIPNNNNLLINNNNVLLNIEMINASEKYTETDNIINFNNKNFDNISDSDLMSVTQNSTYANPKFWKEDILKLLETIILYKKLWI